MEKNLLIGIDVGTTAVKATLFSSTGRVVSQYQKPYPIYRFAGARVEQNPADWMHLVHAALDHFSTVVDHEAVQAIGLTSQVNTHVFLDAQGEALTPAWVWQDGRAAEQAKNLDAQLSDEQRMAWWGAPLPIDASHALSRMQWLLEEDQPLWASTRHVATQGLLPVETHR